MNKGPAIILSLFFLFNIISCRKVPQPPLPDDPNVFDACIEPGTNESLDIVTFNVETFPRGEYNSVIMTASLLNTIDADVYALQEVALETGFDQLIELLPGYSGLFYLTDEDEWNLAYIFKNSEVTVDESATRLLFTDSEYYLRPAFEVKIHHIPTGIDTYIINNHFKCCGEGESIRRESSEIMKDYIDTYRNEDAVIVLGDLNDELTGETSGTNPFLCFIDDPDNYEFADMDIAKGSSLFWSYPSWPSHLDHILITDELFENLDTTIVYRAAPCYPDYGTYISDHRPVGIRLVN